ncbi:MAG: DUF1844 domain-containing protein [Nitrospiraceae bacterium]
MSGEQEQGFVIRDRRGRAGQDDSLPDSPPASPAQPSAQGTEVPDEASSHSAALPVTFSSFVVSLGTSALMLMGEQLDPHQQRVPVNLPQAKEIIDLLSMLDTKTRGNLTSEEQAVLSEMLYAVRMKYVDAASSTPTHKP